MIDRHVRRRRRELFHVSPRMRHAVRRIASAGDMHEHRQTVPSGGRLRLLMLTRRTPSVCRPSSRPYPETLPPIEYAGHLEVRKIEHNGMMRWKNGRIFTSKTLRVVSTSASKRSTTASRRSTTAPVLLARVDEREMKFYD